MEIEQLHLCVTRNCTLCCEHCLRGDRAIVNMDNETIDYVFADVKKVKTLLITGGEPLIAVQALEHLIEVLINKGISVTEIRLITNGTIYSERIHNILDRFSNIASLNLKVSANIFHLLELRRLGLEELRNKNCEILKRCFQAEEYAVDGESKYKEGLSYMGRAVNLTKERLEEIHKISKTRFFLEKGFYDCQPHTEYSEEEDKISGAITVDVYGRLTNYGLSFALEDEFAREHSYNIKEIGFRDAALAFTNDYLEKQEQLMNKLLKK